MAKMDSSVWLQRTGSQNSSWDSARKMVKHKQVSLSWRTGRLMHAPDISRGSPFRNRRHRDDVSDTNWRPHMRTASLRQRTIFAKSALSLHLHLASRGQSQGTRSSASSLSHFTEPSHQSPKFVKHRWNPLSFPLKKYIFLRAMFIHKTIIFSQGGKYTRKPGKWCPI